MRRVIERVDGDTVRAIGRGDRQAFALLLDEFSPHVLGMMHQVIDDSIRSEAITQTVFLEVWRSAPRYDEATQQPLAWVMTIALRRAFASLRASMSVFPPDLPAQSGAYAIEMGRVQLALSDLTDLQREVISMTYFEFRSTDEIAEALNVSPATVRTRTRDALLTLRLAMIGRHRDD